MRALGDQEGESGSGGDYTLYIIEDSVQLNQIKVAASILGVSLNIVTLDEETRTSKEHKNKNPTGKYPLLESKEGTLSGVVSITKFLCKKSKKLLGDNSALSLTKIDQWSFWSIAQLEPTCQQVMQGIFEADAVYMGSWNDSSKALKDMVKQVNKALMSSDYLCGNQMTIADVLVATSLI